MTPREIGKRLGKEGWIRREGSRHTLYTKAGFPMIQAPRHARDVTVGVLKDIQKKAGW